MSVVYMEEYIAKKKADLPERVAPLLEFVLVTDDDLNELGFNAYECVYGKEFMERPWKWGMLNGYYKLRSDESCPMYIEKIGAC
jgi:hypothetical protein